MDLTVTITDENGDVLGSHNVYRDGSDSEGAASMIDVIKHRFPNDEDDEDE